MKKQLQNIADRAHAFPLYSQEEVAFKDKIVCAKLSTWTTNTNWYITEYDPKKNIAFGYVE